LIRPLGQIIWVKLRLKTIFVKIKNKKFPFQKNDFLRYFVGNVPKQLKSSAQHDTNTRIIVIATKLFTIKF